ncbi:MAG TPA: isoprenylcysteine carboxylmethyltransferase family protein [Candidatus Dormibacteraeota bacterium]|nr:isoprenylcysteine carboxylmethyltransferase family protein [Candidatus Dormibacteraeota bacterium]
MAELTRVGFLALLGVVGVLRLVELRISLRNERFLVARGAQLPPDPSFRWMVILHVGVLAGAGAEVWFWRRPFVPALAAAMGVLFLAANGLRWWVIHTLGRHWSVEVVDAGRLGVVDTGPYRLIRHPNYAAVLVEMLALPLIHTAWVTAAVSTPAHWLVLRSRLRTEDRMLLANPEYRRKMGYKPRFVPRLFSRPEGSGHSALPGSPVD